MRPINSTGDWELYGSWSGGVPVKLLKTMQIWTLHKRSVQISVLARICSLMDHPWLWQATQPPAKGGPLGDLGFCFFRSIGSGWDWGLNHVYWFGLWSISNCVSPWWLLQEIVAIRGRGPISVTNAHWNYNIDCWKNLKLSTKKNFSSKSNFSRKYLFQRHHIQWTNRPVKPTPMWRQMQCNRYVN